MKRMMMGLGGFYHLFPGSDNDDDDNKKSQDPKKSFNQIDSGSSTATSPSSSSSSSSSPLFPPPSELSVFIYDHRTTVAAATASIASTLIGFPLDSLKARLQVKKYRSVWDCVSCVYRDEGIKGFFRGVWVPLFSISLVRTISFTIYDNTKASLYARGYFASAGPPTSAGPSRNRSSPTKTGTQSSSSSTLSSLLPPSLSSSSSASSNEPPPTASPSRILFDKAGAGFVGGATSGSMITFGSCGFELVKIRAQLQRLIATSRGEPWIPEGTFKGAWRIYQRGGIRGLYAGLPIHLARDSLGSGLYFAFYDSLRYSVSRYDDDLPLGIPRPAAPFLCGSLSGIASWAVLYPIDVWKTTVQRDALAGKRSKNAFTVLKELSSKGVRRLYRGLGVSAIRSSITHGCMWSLLEEVKIAIERHHAAAKKSKMRLS